MMGLTNAEINKFDKESEPAWGGVVNLQYYKENFEDEYIRQTTDYYEQECKKWVSSMSCPEYVKIATDSLKKEEEKVINFLDKETRPKLVSQLDDKIIGAHAQKLTEMDKTGVAEMLNNKKNAELKALNQLLSRKPDTLCHILDKLKPYILLRGKNLEKTKEVYEDPVKYTEKLLELKKEMDSLMQDSFGGMEQFVRANDLAFQEIMDSFELTPKYLAIYIDDLMRQGLRGKEAETESIIENVFGLFKLLKSKDAFTEHHKELYAMRLLQHTSISDTAEELLISKMKIELGTQHVSKYVQMGVDMKNSKEQTEKFKSKEHKGVISGVELSVKVLTSGLWGGEQNANCKLPKVLHDCCERFEYFYKEIHVGRHLVWNASIGDCEVKANSFSKPYTLLVTVYQASILDLFNNQSTFTYRELLEQTKLPESTMSKQILNLTNPKMGKLLIKDNLKTPVFAPTEKVVLNSQFSSPSLRLSLIPAAAKKVKRSL